MKRKTEKFMRVEFRTCFLCSSIETPHYLDGSNACINCHKDLRRNWKLYLALFLMCMPVFSSIYHEPLWQGRAVYPKENKVEEGGPKGDIGIPGPPGTPGVLAAPPTCQGEPITAACLGNRLDMRSIEITGGVGIKVSDSIGFSIGAVQISNEQFNWNKK